LKSISNVLEIFENLALSLSFRGLYRFDEFELDPSRRSLSRDGTVIPLSSKAFQVLTYLVANPGRVVTKDELLKAVWPESFVEESNLPGYISGQGYQFTASVQAELLTHSSTQPGPQDIHIQQMRESTHVVIRETSSPVPALAEPRSLGSMDTAWRCDRRRWRNLLRLLRSRPGPATQQGDGG
jgi:DNA-binding winged helix-turn-helix (wHTH) protein